MHPTIHPVVPVILDFLHNSPPSFFPAASADSTPLFCTLRIATLLRPAEFLSHRETDDRPTFAVTPVAAAVFLGMESVELAAALTLLLSSRAICEKRRHENP